MTEQEKNGAGQRIARGLYVALEACALLCLTGFTAATSQAAPTITLTAPGDGLAWNAPVNLALRATAAVDPVDTGATMVRVEFHADGVLIGSDTTASTTGVYGVTWSSVPVGSHTLTATAIDSLIDQWGQTRLILDRFGATVPHRPCMGVLPWHAFRASIFPASRSM